MKKQIFILLAAFVFIGLFQVFVLCLQNLITDEFTLKYLSFCLAAFTTAAMSFATVDEWRA